MPTLIKFAGGDGQESSVATSVTENAEEIFDAMRDANGLPFVLTDRTTGRRVYINPPTIAYWLELSDRSTRSP